MLILKKLQDKLNHHTQHYQTESSHTTLSKPKSANWNVFESSHSMKRV